RPIWCAQAQFNPRVPAVDVHFGVGRVEKHVIVRKKPGVTIVPSAKLRVPGLDVAEVRLRQLHRYIVIVEVPERVTIDREQSIFVESPFEVQILDATVRLIAWQPVLLLELRAIATRYYAADSELDPIFVFFGLLFRGGSSY